MDELEEDEVLKKVQEESLRYYKEVELPRLKNETEKEETRPETTPSKDLLSSQALREPGSLLYNGEVAQGFYIAAGSSYIYPTNYPIRQYQMNIVKTALFKNTLVSLPTGLGKTFIAAVVMYNYYRWYPFGKIIFMAPTRPLVAQQIKACHHIMNIPMDDTTEMTGTLNVHTREILWKEKRVFFLTPQVMINDLKSKICPYPLIKCLVVDEAHRAVKDYAYCQVVKFLEEADCVYRILALSATPGNDVNSVQQVIKNLKISSLELRGEDALDVAPYTHARSVDSCIVEPSINIQKVKQDFLQVYDKYARKLKDFKALPNNISTISKFQVLKASEKFRANPPRGVLPSVIGSIIGDFTVCMCMAHALDLLQIYGLRAFFNYLREGGNDKSKAAASRLNNDEDLKKILDRLDQILKPLPGSEGYIWGHPKYKKLVSVLDEHFNKCKKEGESTRAIIFCEYRVVVSEVFGVLKSLEPQIRPAMFVGQSGGKERGMPQAKQLEIMKGFRCGEFNCLVATCVAEEGLDIGDVDLIVLCEAHKSITRLVQRMGRTGRKRKGRCTVLLTKGKEEYKFSEAMASRKSYVSNILNSKVVRSSLLTYSPRMLPPDVKPEKELVHINVEVIVTPAKPTLKKQIDIRECLVQAESPFLSKTEFKEVIEELGTNNLSFDKIPSPKCHFWDRVADKNISIEELLKKDVDCLSEWIDWNKEEQTTFDIDHSEDTQIMCNILSNAGKINFLGEHIKKGKKGSNKKERETSDNCLEEEPEGIKNTEKDEKRNNKEIQKKASTMDIRQCMARAVEKTKVGKKKIGNENYDIDLSSETETDNNFLVEDIMQSIKAKFSTDWVEAYDVLIKRDEIKCPFGKDIEMCSLLEKYMLPPSNENISLTLNTVLPNIKDFCNDVDELILESLDISCSTTENLHNLSAERWQPSPDYRVAIEMVCFEEEKDKVFDDYVGIDELFNEARIEIEEDELNNSDLEKKEQNVEPVELDINETNQKPRTIEEINISANRNIARDVLKDLKINDWEEEPSCFEGILEGEFTDDWIPCSQENSPRSNTMSLVKLSQDKTENTIKLNRSSSFKSSTPITKNQCKEVNLEICAKRSLLPMYKKLESVVNEEQIETEKSVKEDIWNLSDLFEENTDENNDNHNNDITMLGITQMVSLIEKEKAEKFDQISKIKTESHETISNQSLQVSNLVTSSSSTTVRKENSKPEEADSLLLDMDDDIFADMDDLFETKDQGPKKMENSEVGIIKSEAIYEKSDATTSVGAMSEQFPVILTGDTTPKIKNFKKFNSSKKTFACEEPVLTSIEIPLGVTNCPMKRKGLSLKYKHVLSLTNENQSVIQTSNVEPSRKLFNESEKFDFEPLNQSKNDFKSPVGITSNKFKYSRNLRTIEEVENNSILIETQRKSRKRKSLFSDLDDDDIFKTSSQNLSMLISPIHHPKQQKKKREKQLVCPFIENEADESGAVTTDEDDSSLDEFDRSFIDDNSPDLDIRSRYLQSIKSPVVGKFKIPERKNYPQDVYSQIVMNNNSEYINDSFCVDSDEEIVETEQTVLELAEKKLAQRSSNQQKNEINGEHSMVITISSDEESENDTRIWKRKFSNSDSEPSDCEREKIKPKRFKRIKRLNSSGESSS